MDRPIFTLGMALDILEQMEAGQESHWLFVDCGDATVADMRKMFQQTDSPISLSAPATLADADNGTISISVQVSCKGMIWHTVTETYTLLFFPRFPRRTSW